MIPALTLIAEIIVGWLIVVVIAAMLMYLHTGGRPSKYLFSLLSLAGGGSIEDILPILRERERQCEVDRRSAAIRRARRIRLCACRF